MTTKPLYVQLDANYRQADAAFRRVLSQHGLNAIESYVLLALCDEDGQRASDLARAVCRPSTSFTPNLDRLEKFGLIERRSNQADRRAIRVCLTDSGRDLAHTLRASLAATERDITQHIDPADMATFYAVLERLTLNAGGALS